MSKRLVTDIPDADHRKIKAAAAAAGWTMGSLVRRLLEMWLAGKVNVGKPPARGGT